MKDFYRTKLSGIVNMPDTEMGMGMFSNAHLLMFLAAALVVKGIIIFVLPRTHGSYLCALVKGAMYGLIIGGSYQLMNLAIIAGWPVEVVYYGIAWKMVVCACVTAFTVWVAEMCGCEHMCSCECDGKGKGKGSCRSK
jgi:uncharacterized membrane protein